MQLAARPRATAGAKQVATRQWITAGVALAGAGMIAVAPGVNPVLPSLQHDVQASAVRLTAGWDPLAPWKDAFDTTKANATTIFDNFALAPGVGLQQAIVNEIAFAKQVLADPSSFNDVAKQFAANVKTVASALVAAGLDPTNDADKAILDTVTKHTTSGLHGFLISSLGGFLPPDTDTKAVGQVLQLLASPLSGLLIGMAGPMLSPGVALVNSFQAISDAIKAGDSSEAFSDVLAAPASMVNAFFNGADLNLNAVASLLNQAGVLPAGTTIDTLDVAFGGLFTPGTTGGPTYEVKDAAGNVVKSIPAPGGSILNSLGLTITTDALGAPLTLPITSSAVGPLGALEGLSQTVGVLLGDGWDSWDGKGNPPPPKPPLFGLSSDTASDTAQESVATNLRAMLHSLDLGHLADKPDGVGVGTPPATDNSATDNPATDNVASPNVLTRATANKMVALSVPKPSTSATTSDATSSDDTDAAAAAGSSANSAEAGSLGGSTTVQDSPTAVSGKTGKWSSANANRPRPLKGVSDGIKHAVGNVRGGLGGQNGHGSTRGGGHDGHGSASGGNGSSGRGSAK